MVAMQICVGAVSLPGGDSSLAAARRVPRKMPIEKVFHRARRNTHVFLHVGKGKMRACPAHPVMPCGTRSKLLGAKLDAAWEATRRLGILCGAEAQRLCPLLHAGVAKHPEEAAFGDEEDAKSPGV